MPDSSDRNSRPTVADFVLQRLARWNVRRIFGYPGDGINGLMSALRRSGGRFDFVQVAHEELAGLMATAHAKFTGEPGVCLVTSGPGAVHLLNGLYDAKLDHQPLVAIVGQQSFAGVGSGMQQETNLHSLLEDVASAYLETISTPEQARHVIDRAFRIARGRSTVTAIILPHDVQLEEAVEHPPEEHGYQHSSPGWWEPRVLPREKDLRRAAAILNEGRKVAMLVGAGALNAGAEIIAVAERLGAGVAKSLLGKAAVPDDLPFVTGAVGYLGTTASNRLMEECDTLLMVGTNMPYTEYLPREGQARAVQIDRDPESLALRYPMEVALAGDAAETLRALLPLLEDRTDRAWRRQIEENVSAWWQEAERRARASARPINPQLPVWELSSRLPDDAILTADSGSSAVWLARDIRIRQGMMASLSGGLSTMGSAVPYALAAKLAFPERLVVALVGDGAMQMSGNNALIDVAKRWRAWRDPRLVVVVFNNRDLNYVTWEQRFMEGDARYVQSQALPDFPYADYAGLLGLGGMRVERPERVPEALDQALSAQRPMVLDFVVDPDVPTLPPRIRKSDWEKLDRALEEDPEASGVREQMKAQGIRY